MGDVQDVAIKVVRGLDEITQERFLVEIATLRTFRHPNIIMFMGASIQQGKTLLMMQYMQHGDLHQALKQQPGRFGWYER